MDETFEKYFNVALKFLSYRPRSEKEVRDRLERKKIDPQIIDKIVLRLTELRFLNDLEFVKWWIESRTRFKPRSLRLIKFELQQKGIPFELIESGIRNQESSKSEKDLENAKKLVESKIHKYKGLSKFELTQKLGPFLQRRGFGYETIKSAIDEALKDGV